MVKNCGETMVLRNTEVAALEKEINPMHSNRKKVAFRHCLIKILEEMKALHIL